MIKLYFLTLAVFLSIDGIRLGLIAKNLYKQGLGTLMKTDINRIAAGIFYLIFSLGIVLFVISPALEKHSWSHALIYGALFGLMSYATYDLTNLATLTHRPLHITLIDLAWWSVLCASVSVIVYFIMK